MISNASTVSQGTGEEDNEDYTTPPFCFFDLFFVRMISSIYNIENIKIESV